MPPISSHVSQTTPSPILSRVIGYPNGSAFDDGEHINGVAGFVFYTGVQYLGLEVHYHDDSTANKLGDYDGYRTAYRLKDGESITRIVVKADDQYVYSLNFFGDQRSYQVSVLDNGNTHVVEPPQPDMILGGVKGTQNGHITSIQFCWVPSPQSAYPTTIESSGRIGPHPPHNYVQEDRNGEYYAGVHSISVVAERRKLIAVETTYRAPFEAQTCCIGDTTWGQSYSFPVPRDECIQVVQIVAGEKYLRDFRFHTSKDRLRSRRFDTDPHDKIYTLFAPPYMMLGGLQGMRGQGMTGDWRIYNLTVSWVPIPKPEIKFVEVIATSGTIQGGKVTYTATSITGLTVHESLNTLNRKTVSAHMTAAATAYAAKLSATVGVGCVNEISNALVFETSNSTETTKTVELSTGQEAHVYQAVCTHEYPDENGIMVSVTAHGAIKFFDHALPDALLFPSTTVRSFM